MTFTEDEEASNDVTVDMDENMAIENPHTT